MKPANFWDVVSSKFPPGEPAKFLGLFELEYKKFTLKDDSIYHKDLTSVDDLIAYSTKVGVWDAYKYDFSSKSTRTTAFAKSLT